MINIVHIGIGPLGQRMVRFAHERNDLRIVGAVDTHPEMVGRALGSVCDVPGLEMPIASGLEAALSGGSAQVAIVTTVSSLASLEPLVATLARTGIHTISTCEELLYPWNTQTPVAGRIDKLCQAHGVVCLGTGINPGYLMDYLPTVLTGLCQSVSALRVTRVQDASIRRIPFQQKIGAGLTLDAFEKKRKQGTLRHVGLPESVDFVASRLGWRLDRNTESLEPVIAEQEVTTGHRPIAKGMVRGVHQVGRGFVGDAEVITLTFRAAVGEPEAYDEVEIEGDPPIRSRIHGGVNGDIATCSVTLNAIQSVLSAKPGLRTMGDIAPISWRDSLPS